MLRIRFFAAIRERLGRSSFDLDLPAGVGDVASLVQHLDASALPGCASVLMADNTLVAVNRSVAGMTASLSGDDEIAFYPPVTGG